MSAAQHGSPEPVREGEEPAPQVPWQRVHPLTPLVRFWAFFVLLAFSFLRQGAEELVEHQDSGSWIGEVPAAVARADARTWALVGGGVLVVLVPMVLSWWFHRFRIVQDVLQVRHGALFRSEKQARLDRVQSIEITQHFLPRLLGLAELRFDVADAGQAVLSLAYLRRRRAEGLREDLLRRRTILQDADGGEVPARSHCSAAAVPGTGAGGTAPADAGHKGSGPDRIEAETALVPHQPAAPLLVLPLERVVGAILLEPWWMVILALMVLAILLFSAVGAPEAIAPIVVPLGLALVSGFWSRLKQWGGFRLFAEEQAVRIHSGLFSTVQRTLPRGRVQAIGITQPLLWRMPGWFRVTVTVAGSSSSGTEQARTHRVLVPMATGQELVQVLPLVLESPRPGDLDGAQMQAALEGSGTEHGFTVAPRRARWLVPLTWRRTGFVDAGQYLFLRRGRLTRRLTAIPHDRTQSLDLSDGPLLRRLGLADISFHTVSGPVSAVLPHLDAADARRLAVEQAARAAVARRAVPTSAPEPTSASVPAGAPVPAAVRPVPGPRPASPSASGSGPASAAEPSTDPGEPLA